MADIMKRELSININTNVDTQPIKTAEQEINGFFEKYENRSLELGIDKRSLKIDTKDFYKAIAAAQQLESSIDGVRRSAPAMIKALNTDIEFAENVKGEFQEAMAVFNDGSIARGFNEIIDKLSDGLSMVAVDLGGRVDYIKKQITGMLSQIREAGSVSLGNEIEFGSLNQKEINQRIQLIGKLIEAQKELQSFSPTQLDEYDFESGYDTKGLERLGRNLERASAKMEEYNLRTTEQLRRREELIDRIYRIDYSSYDQKEAKSKIGDEYEYEANIASLREYIEQRQDLLRELRNSEDELFSSEGISEYVMQLNEQIQRYEEYIKELQDLRNPPIGDPSEIVNALKEIKEVIKEIKDAFEPLTTALNTEGTAFSNMAKEGAASLDTLLDKLKELGSLMNSLNQKDFNVTNLITQKGNVSESVLALREQAKSLLNVVNVLVEAQNEIYKTNNDLYQGAMRQSQGVMGSHLWELQNFDSADIYKKITKSGSEAKLMEHIATLEYYRDVVLTIVKEINKYAPNTIDTSVLEQVQQQKKLAASSETSGSDLKDKKDSAGGIESLLEEIKSSREQIESELKEIRTLIEATFDLSTIDMKRDAFTAILDSVYQQFVELQVKIKALDFSIDVPNNISFTNANKSVAQSGDNTEGSIIAAANAIDKEGQAAEEAAISKIKFADANKEVALSSDATAHATKDAADSIKKEGQAAEEAAAKSKKALKGLKITQEEIIEQYHDAGKRGQVRNNLADMFNKSLENAGIDASKIIASYGEKSYKDDDGDTRYFDYIKLVANGTNEIGKAVIVTREYNIATGELLKTVTQFSEAKDTFDLSTVKNTASSQFAELEKRMGSFKIDISDVRNALNNITDEASFKVFQNELDAANQKLKEIKASLKSSRSLDPIVNAEGMMSNLETTVATYRENIKKFTDVEGFDKLDSSLTTITSKLEEFKVAQSAGDGEKMASIVAEINKEITSYNANLKLVTARYQENTRASNEYAKAEKQRIAEENAAWDEYRAEQKAAAQKERDIALAYEAKAAQEAAEAEKELAKARKEADSFYEQEEKRIAAEEDAAWKEYKKEKEAAAQKEREINLAYEAKAAKEAADAEKELAQARKEADAFYKEEEQQIKNDNNEKQKELNALYTQRKAIISELLDYTKKLNQATDEASKKAAQQAIDSAASRLGDKNAEIWQYGDLVDVLKLNQQDESLTEGLRRFNWDSYIKNAGKSSKLNLDVEQQLSLLTKQQALWEKNGQLTDELRQKINNMFDALSKVTNASELSTWKKQWSIVKNEVTETKYQIEAAEKAQKEASNAISSERKASAEYWNSAFKESIENLGPKKNPELEQLNAYYKEQEKLNKQNQNYGKTRYNQEIRNYEKLMASVRAIDNESGLSDGFQKKVAEYKDLYEELGRLRKQFEDDPNAANDSALTNKFQDTALQAEKARKEIQGVIKETDRLDALTADGGFEIKLFDQSKFDNAKDAMRAYANEVSNGTFEEKGFNDAGTEMYGTLINSEGAIEKVTIALKEASGEIVAFKTGTEGVTSVWKTATKSVVGGVAKFGAMYLSFHDIIRYLRQGVESVREIDLAMTELRKVTDETEETYAKFLNTASKTAGSIGSTVKDFTTVTSDFARLGYSINEASELAKTALIYENVGDGFSSVDEASASIISTMKAFGIEAENTMQIVDKFNAVGNNFAIDSKGIGDALQRSASALVEGGNSIDEAIGIVTAANSVIQNPEQVGTALKTLSLRLRSTKVELEEMGEDAEGAASSTAKLRAQLLGLTGGKVDIMLDETTFKNTTQILREMAAVWDEMDDISRAGALELMGGKRQANILSSLITNFETVEQVIETSANSAGSALAENEKYLDSIQGKIDQFNNALQTFWNNLLNSEMIKGIIDFGTAILDFFNKIGPELTSLIAIIGGISVATLFKGLNTWFNDVSGDITLVKALTKSFDGLKGGITGVGKALKGLVTNPIFLIAAAVTAAALAFDHFHTTAQEAADAAKEAFDEIQGLVNSTKSSIQALESELSTIQDQIDALNGKTLSFAEEQELERLKKQREELEYSLKIQKQLLELQQDTSNKQAIASMKAYTKAASQGAKETQETAKTWGSIAGGILAAAGVVASVLIPGDFGSIGAAAVAGGKALATTAGTAAVVGGTVAGGKAGEAIGSSVASNDGTYDAWYETYTKALETTRKEEQKALEQYQKDSSNIEKLDKWQEAQQKTADIENEMYEHISQLQQYRSTLEYGIDDETDKKLADFDNFLDKFFIDQDASGAEVTALDRIFGENASEEIKEIKEQILDAVTTGEDFDFESAVNGSQELKGILDYIGLDVEHVKNYFTQVGEAAIAAAKAAEINPVDTYSAITESVSKYNEILEKTSEIIGDNTKVTQEYKDSLVEIGISEEELNKYFDENNDLIVKNAKGLKKLISQDVKLKKAQHQLDYYNLVKQLNSTLNVTKQLDSVTKDSIYTLLNQIDVVGRATYQYQLLEDSLLGAHNAFNEFAQAQEVDSLNTYGDSYTEMVQTMYDAMFKTGQVGTEAFETAVEFLVPESIYQGIKDEADRMKAIYDYFNGNILPTGRLDEDTFSLDYDSLEYFVKEGLKSGVFIGDIENFDLVEGMNLDEAAEKLGYTKTQAYALFAELDKYNTNGTELSFLSQLDDSLEGRIINITNDIEELNRQKLALLEDGGYEKNKEQIDAINDKLTKCNESLEATREEAYVTWQEYAKNDVALSALDAIANKQQEITKEGATTLGLEWDEVKGKTIQQVYDELLVKKQELGIPTELVLQFAQDKIQDELDGLEQKLEEKEIDIKANVVWNATDEKYEVAEDSKHTNDKDVQEYVKLSNEQYALDSYLDDGLTTTEDYLSNIVDILQNIYDIQSGKDPEAIDEVTQTEGQSSVEEKGAQSNEGALSGVGDFFTETIPDVASIVAKEIGEFFTEDIPNVAADIGNEISEFFTVTIPQKWDEFWNIIDGYLTQLKEEAEELYNTIKVFFTETIPEKWNELWDGVDKTLTEDVPYAIGYAAGVVYKFFTKTIPDAWNEFWDSIDNFFTKTIPNAANSVKNAVIKFFTVTVPEKWNEFWGHVENFFTTNILPALQLLGDKISTFFTGTIPAKWNEFWDSVSIFFTETVPNALQQVKDKLTTFFTVTLPEKWTALWNDIEIFFTEIIPQGFETIKTGITTFFTETIPGFFTGLWNDVSSWISEKASAFWDNLTAGWFDGSGGSEGGGGGAGVNGTAHASGTAHAKGNWGAPKTETALVGELGPEMVVRGNRWFTVGDNGAEFTDIKKGDIIFNHKQTEDLLSKGYVTGRGKAYASGTAYSGLWNPTSPKTSQSNDPGDDFTKKGQALYDAADSLSGASDDIKDAAEDVVDFIEIKLEEIESKISKTTAKIENYVDDASKIKQKNNEYDNLVDAEKNKAATYFSAAEAYNKRAAKLLKDIPSEYREMAKNGAIAIEDFIGENETEVADRINEYREWNTKADEAEIGYLESIAQVSAYRIEQLEDIATDYENLVNLVGSESSLIQAEMDLVEESGERLSSAHYEALIKNTLENKKTLQKEKSALEKEFKDAVEAGDIKVGSDDWYAAIEKITAVDEKIIQCDIDIESFKNSINDLKWDSLDRIIDRFDSLGSELSYLYERLTDVEDVVDDNGDWTDKSIAAMGVLAQQMEIAQAKTEQYDNAIVQLKRDYKKGLYSTDEYNEKLAELTEKQWESIDAYEDAKDKIVDLNKARIEAIKEGMQEEIDAYKELIDLKKESLDAEKDLHDFEKSVAEKQKSISDIRRKLAALEGDTSASAAAKRKQLEAELLEAEAELEETYYDRSIQNQKDALDQEYESFEENKNAEMEALDEYLTNEEQVILDSMNTVRSNASIVLAEIQTVSQQYGIGISSAITTPWTEGSNAVTAFEGQFTTSTSATNKQLDLVIAKEKALETQALKTAQAMLAVLAASGAKIKDIEVPEIITNKGSNDSKDNKNDDKNEKDDSKPTTYEVKKGDTLSGIAKKYLGSTSKWREIYNANKDIIKDPNKIYPGQKLKIPKYATGTLGTKNDQFAWIDEVGEELVLHAGSNGKLAYLTKGTSVIPSDLTNKLLDLAIDPTQTLENSRPVVSAPHIVNNEINIDMSFGEVVHIDTVTNDTIPNLTKAVEKQMDKYMKQLNGQIRKYAR